MGNCSDITKFGIFDTSTESREEDLVTSHLKWLTNQEAKTESGSSDTSLGIGISLPKIPIGFNFDGGHAAGNATSWSRSLSEYLQNNSDARMQYSKEFVTANPAIVQAWSNCVQNSKGLICWAEQTENPKEVLLKVELRPYTYDEATSPKIVKIVTSQNVKTDEDVTGITLGAAIRSILFERNGNDWRHSANFNVITDDINYSDACSVPPIPKVPTCGGRGLLAAWNGEGTAADALGKYDGIASAGVTYVEGVKSDAFNFDGSTGIIVTPLTVSYSNGVSFSCWVKTTASTGVLMADGGGASEGFGMGLFLEPGGKLLLGGSKGTGGDANFGVLCNPINDGAFHHIVATWTGDTSDNGVVLYQDGQAVAFLKAKTAIQKGSTPLYFGRHNTLGYYPFAGVLDEIKVFNRAISQDDVRRLYQR